MAIHEDKSSPKPSYNVMLLAIVIVALVGFAILFLTFR